MHKLIESCDVLGMGMGHSGQVGVVLKDETQLIVTGPDASPLFYEAVASQDAWTPDRCQIIFSIE